MLPIDPDSLQVSQAKFKRLYSMVDELLDRAALDDYAPAIQAATGMLALLDNIQYNDDDGGLEDFEDPEPLDFYTN